MESGHTLLSGLSEVEQSDFLRRCNTRTVSPRSVIVSQGSVGRDMFIVESGSLKVTAISDEGKEISFGVLRQGEYFGELSLIDGRRRSATVTAIEPSSLLVLGYPEYQGLLRDHPHTATKLLTQMLLMMANRLRATDELYQDSVFLDVSARLAKFLLGASDLKDDSSDTTAQVGIKLSQYELGTLVNASRESVNKQLKDWESQGVVAIDRGMITLLKPAVLQQTAQGA